MKPIINRLIPATFFAAALICSTPRAAAAATDQSRNNGKFFFDKETFGGNGRTCVTCHSEKTGTFPIEEAQISINAQGPRAAGCR